MIEPIMRVVLNNNQYSSLCFLASHNDKENNYVTDINTAFSRFKDFMTRSEMVKSVENDVKYVIFSKES